MGHMVLLWYSTLIVLMVHLELLFLTLRALLIEWLIGRKLKLQHTNKEVTKVCSEGKGVKQQASYLKATPAQKALVSKYVAEHGVLNSIRH